MRHNRKKISKITDELEAFCFSVGARDISINIKYGKDEFTVTVSSDYDPSFRHKVDKLDEMLNPTDRDDGIVGTFWELLGESDPDYEIQLELVGQLISDAKVSISEEKFDLVLHKKNEH